MDRDELGAVRKRAFHLDLADHLAYAFHHAVQRENRRPDAHDLGNRSSVADQFEDFRGDQRNRFRMIEPEPAGAPPSRELAGAEDEELVDFARYQMHEESSLVTVVPLLAPRVAVVVIAVRFPESGLIAIDETQLSHPLRALPEVEVRYEEPRGAAVLGLERRA